MTAMPPVVPWDRLRRAMRWQQGEHVSLIGPTGTGKTTAMLGLLDMRRYVVVIGTKPQDRTLSSLIKQDGYKRVYEWPPPVTRNRVVLWPRISRASDISAAAEVIRHALDEAFAEGGWTVASDEVWYLAHKLKLGDLLETYWSQGRSIGLTHVATTQRPAWVPRLMYSSATHLFFWRDNDATNLDAMKNITSGARLNSGDIRKIVSMLEQHEALYVNTRTGDLFRTTAPERR